MSDRTLVLDKHSKNQLAQPGLSKRRRVTFPPDADGFIDAERIAKMEQQFPGLQALQLRCTHPRIHLEYYDWLKNMRPDEKQFLDSRAKFET